MSKTYDAYKRFLIWREASEQWRVFFCANGLLETEIEELLSAVRASLESDDSLHWRQRSLEFAVSPVERENPARFADLEKEWRALISEPTCVGKGDQSALNWRHTSHELRGIADAEKCRLLRLRESRCVVHCLAATFEGECGTFAVVDALTGSEMKTLTVFLSEQIVARGGGPKFLSEYDRLCAEEFFNQRRLDHTLRVALSGKHADKLLELERMALAAVQMFRGDAPRSSDGIASISARAEQTQGEPTSRVDSPNDQGVIKTGNMAPASPKSSRSRRKPGKRPGDCRPRIIAALTKHHKYEDGSCMNLEPIRANKLALDLGISTGSVSSFWKNEFGDYNGYCRKCMTSSSLVASLALLNGEFTPKRF